MILGGILVAASASPRWSGGCMRLVGAVTVMWLPLEGYKSRLPHWAIVFARVAVVVAWLLALVLEIGVSRDTHATRAR